MPQGGCGGFLLCVVTAAKFGVIAPIPTPPSSIDLHSLPSILHPVVSELCAQQ